MPRPISYAVFCLKKKNLRRVLRAFGKRTGMPEPAMHVYMSAPPTVLDETLSVVQSLATAQIDVTGERLFFILRRPRPDLHSFPTRRSSDLTNHQNGKHPS